MPKNKKTPKQAKICLIAILIAYLVMLINIGYAFITMEYMISHLGMEVIIAVEDDNFINANFLVSFFLAFMVFLFSFAGLFVANYKKTLIVLNLLLALTIIPTFYMIICVIDKYYYGF